MENNYGAKAGLEKKMQYWKDRDYQYEFGVTLGQAFNLANEKSKDNIVSKTQVLEVFKLLLRAKLDPEVIDLFNEYYDRKVNNHTEPQSTIKTVTLD